MVYNGLRLYCKDVPNLPSMHSFFAFKVISLNTCWFFLHLYGYQTCGSEESQKSHMESSPGEQESWEKAAKINQRTVFQNTKTYEKN